MSLIDYLKQNNPYIQKNTFAQKLGESLINTLLEDRKQKEQMTNNIFLNQLAQKQKDKDFEQNFMKDIVLQAQKEGQSIQVESPFQKVLKPPTQTSEPLLAPASRHDATTTDILNSIKSGTPVFLGAKTKKELTDEQKIEKGLKIQALRQGLTDKTFLQKEKIYKGYADVAEKAMNKFKDFRDNAPVDKNYKLQLLKLAPVANAAAIEARKYLDELSKTYFNIYNAEMPTSITQQIPDTVEAENYLKEQYGEMLQDGLDKSSGRKVGKFSDGKVRFLDTYEEVK